MITIRKATSDDAPAIVSFQKAMAMETEGMELDSDVVTEGVMALFDDAGKGQYFVAEEQDTVVASLMITYEWSDWRNGDFWWVQSVYVAPAFRRQGIFTRIFRAVEEAARGRPDVVGLRLYVEKENRTAQETYRRLGMARSGYAMFELEFSRPVLPSR